MKWIFIALIFISIIAVLVLVLVKSDTQPILVFTPESKETNMLVVIPQPELDSRVVVEQVMLTNPGFLVVRSVENGRLSQIIEVSSYLTAGEHKNITIELGEFYDGNTDLVIVAYQDAHNDQIFNDLDQPMVHADSKVIARYVKTGMEVPSEMFASIGKSMPHMMGGVKMETVRYTNQGFLPNQLEVPAGTVVQFVNESDSSMWVASNEHPGHTDLPTFDQFLPSVKASVYHYTFEQIGTWYFHDHLKPEFIGAINVI